MAVRAARMQKRSPVPGKPDIKFNDPVILKFRVGEKKVQKGIMYIIIERRPFRVRIGETAEKVFFDNGVAARIASGKILRTGNPAGP